MNGPAVPPEILPKHSYGPIAAAQNSADGLKWSLLFLGDASSILVWAH